MLKIIRTILLYCLLASITFSLTAWAECPPVLTKPTLEQIQLGQANARDHGFLWRITKAGHTSFLYGTIHVAKFDWMFPGKKVMQALTSTDTVALEIDLLDTEMQKRIISSMKSIQKMDLPLMLKNRIKRQAEALCFPYVSIENLSPELQVTTLTMIAGRQAGLFGEYAIDAVLAAIGHKSKKHMVSLESPEMQLQILKMHDDQETILFVEDSLKELESGRSFKMLKLVAKHWEDSNYAEMNRFEQWCDCLKTDTEREVMRRALDERNPNLASRIDELHMNGNKTFAAVGSLHMFGELGLPALMKQRGYQVEQVDLK